MLTDSLSLTRWHIAADADDWLTRALTFVAAAEAEALAERGEFHIVLAGGGTPRRLYRALAEENHDWYRWQVWFGDERCLPAEADAPERNSAMAREAWLDKIGVPAGNLHVIQAEQQAAQAANAYARELSGLALFDLVLLGLGQDGHTASLFPGHDWGAAAGAPDVLAVTNAPKPPPERVSLSANRLSRSRRVLFLISGADKRDALAGWRRGVPLPAAAIRPTAGVDVLMDPDACPNGDAS
jgi:6-phosphogluconolactonase